MNANGAFTHSEMFNTTNFSLPLLSNNAIHDVLLKALKGKHLCFSSLQLVTTKSLICVEYQKDGDLVVECDVSTSRYTMFKYPTGRRLYGLLTGLKEAATP